VGKPLNKGEQEMSISERIQKMVGDNRVMVFMKGTPEQPMCGFSNTVVQILNNVGKPYGSANVLDDAADPELREGIKAYSDWPSVPQLYVDGEFVGGCDIAVEMYQSGDLQKLIEKEG